MPIRLIDTNKEYQIDIDGTVFHYRQLNGRDQAMLGLHLADAKFYKGMDGNRAAAEIAKHMPEIEPILARAIVRTENPEMEPSEIMGLIAEPADYMRLAFEIFNKSSVGEGESKNSACSSSSSEAKVGTARAAKTELV
jgi:hypothetical protein